jgi:hypothetical protein
LDSWEKKRRKEWKGKREEERLNGPTRTPPGDKARNTEREREKERETEWGDGKVGNRKRGGKSTPQSPLWLFLSFLSFQRLSFTAVYWVLPGASRGSVEWNALLLSRRKMVKIENAPKRGTIERNLPEKAGKEHWTRLPAFPPTLRLWI